MCPLKYYWRFTTPCSWERVANWYCPDCTNKGHAPLLESRQYCNPSLFLDNMGGCATWRCGCGCGDYANATCGWCGEKIASGCDCPTNPFSPCEK
tara:strand:- start:650 stop:934 length:285 start_codon:yes stop_codon:yes gene_type:complete